jgi:hypothetical protein
VVIDHCVIGHYLYGMDSSVFRDFVGSCVILPEFLRDQLLTKSEELTPEARTRIVKRLEDAERMHLVILQEEGNQILQRQQALKRLLREQQESTEASSPSNL